MEWLLNYISAAQGSQMTRELSTALLIPIVWFASSLISGFLNV